MPRTTAVRIRLTAEERAAITAAAAALGLGICTFSRMAAIKAAGRKPAPAPRRRPDAYARAITGWLGELGRVGNNLNQCAHQLNRGGTVELHTLLEIRDELRALREIVIAFDPDAEP